MCDRCESSIAGTAASSPYCRQGVRQGQSVFAMSMFLGLSSLERSCFVTQQQLEHAICPTRTGARELAGRLRSFRCGFRIRPTTTATEQTRDITQAEAHTVEPAMKVTFTAYHAVAEWKWDLPEDSDDTCGICRVQFEGTCAKCKYPGDDCPISAFDLMSIW